MATSAPFASLSASGEPGHERAGSLFLVQMQGATRALSDEHSAGQGGDVPELVASVGSRKTGDEHRRANTHHRDARSRETSAGGPVEDPSVDPTADREGETQVRRPGNDVFEAARRVAVTTGEEGCRVRRRARRS